MLNVPFENLDIHLNRPIVLTDQSLYQKIVERRRGGFCYELNGLFAWLLTEIGFKVTKLTAGVANEQGEFGPYFDHMALRVELDRPWLVDVGFGDSFLEPLLLDESTAQSDPTGMYRVERYSDHLLLMRRQGDGNWRAEYRFTLDGYQYEDYFEMCRYHQTSPESPFTRGRVCSRATPEGRVTLRDMRLITTVRGEKREQLLANDEEYAISLRELFGVVL
jgi:N-hydroxyarylamine O-acetyltransferase